MDSVFVLWHVHRLPNGEDDEKLIGVYRNDDEAREAIARVGNKPGFSDSPDGFLIDEYKLGQDHWTEGYATV